MNLYISDIITEHEICQWDKGERILISSGTGHGKTKFITDVLAKYCEKNNKKILLLVNRVLLKKQLSDNVGTDSEDYFYESGNPHIRIRLYQSLENEIKRESYSDASIFDGYDYVVLDESHYFLTDSDFSLQTDLVLKSVMKDRKNKIIIFMSATPIGLIDMNIVRPTKKYSIKLRSDYIKDLYFYTKRNIPELICKGIPDGQKVIYFGNANSAFELSRQFDNSAFICAESNKSFYRFVKKSDMEHVIGGTLPEKYLFTTRVLDNGISIHDDNVKHIIVDDSIDPITVIQMIGRRRIMGDDDKVTIYIRSQLKWSILGIISALKSDIAQLDEWRTQGKEEFVANRKKSKISSLFDADMEINLAKEFQKRFMLKIYNEMVSLVGGYDEFMCRLLDYPIEEAKSANTEYQRLKAKDVLSKYANKKLLKEEQKQFIHDFMVAILDPRKEKPVGLSTIRGILEDNNFPYVIESRQERSKTGSSQRIRYWYITEIE